MSISFEVCLYMMQQYGKLLTLKEAEQIKQPPLQAVKYNNKALILDFDDTLRFSIGQKRYPEKPEDIRLLPNRKEKLEKYKKEGWLLLGASNQSAISKGLDEKDCIACFEKTLLLLGVDIKYLYCSHSSNPVTCCCRKPLPGMGACLTYKYKLDPQKCIMVGDAESDKLFAESCGFNYETPDNFFETQCMI